MYRRTDAPTHKHTNARTHDRKVTHMELFEAIYTLRSMRRLKPDPIPDDAIRTILATINELDGILTEEE